MSNQKQPISRASYDSWIVRSYAIISLSAIVAMYVFSGPIEAGPQEMLASVQHPYP